MKYALARIGQALVVLWAAYTLSFVLLHALPGDGIMIKFENPEMGLSPDQIESIRQRYGANVSVVAQYVNSLWAALHGDFGYSIGNSVPVIDRIETALPQSAALAGFGFLLAVANAWVIALAATMSPFGWLRGLLRSVPTLLATIPAFWLGVLLIEVVSFRLGWVPVIGGSTWQQLILPVITVSIPISAPLAQMILGTFEGVGREPFVQVVQAKGSSQWWVLSRHIARNSLLPIMTISGLLFAELLSGAVVTETVFARNGIGRLTMDAVGSQDLPLMQGIVVLAAAGFVIINLGVDLLYPVLDPRLRRAKASPLVELGAPSLAGQEA